MILKTPHGKVYRLFYLTSDMLDHLVADDLGFMKKAHRRVLVEKLERKNKA